MSLYIIIYQGLVMIFVTGLFFYHTKLILKNMTTKEDIKKFWVNPLGNPFNRNNKKINLINSLFPLKQKISIIDILKKGFIKIICGEEIKEKIKIKEEEEENSNEEINNNNIRIINQDNNNDNYNNNSPSRNVNNNNIQERRDTTYNKREQSTGITGNKVQILENKDINSDFISEKSNDSKTNKDNKSIKSFDINVELDEEKIIKKKNLDMNERYSQSMYEIRGNSIRISNCSENITDASGDKRDQFYQTHFENEIHTIRLKPIEE